MKKRGFTLIELLAVIVVLAIIALIATPIVMNVIKNAQMGAAERSADNYVKAVETLIATSKLDGTTIADGEYAINENGNLSFGNVEVSGTRPNGGKIVVKDGQVDKDNTTINYEDYTVTYKDGVAEASEKGTKKLMTLADCDLAAGTANTIGAKYTCNLGDGARTFYVLREDGDNVKLIMNENLGYSAWAESGDNSEGPVTANAYLASQTSGWTKLSQSQITLPDAQDIADAMGDSEWADNNYTGTYGPDWMRTNLDGDNGPYGYWTSTPYSADPSYAWHVDCYGNLVYNDVDNIDSRGVRPVITISKSNLSL